MPGRLGNAAATVTPTAVDQTDASKSIKTATIPVLSSEVEKGQHRKDIQVRLQYLLDDPLYEKVKPVQITPNFLDSKGRTNIALDSGPLETLLDVRGRETQFTLDNNGFCYVHAPTTFTEWSSQPQIGKEYLPELEELLKREVDGCDEVIFYDARIRQEGDGGDRVSGLSFNPFARQVHVDNTERSVLEKIRQTTDLKAEYYLSGRVRIINIWRPIKHPVYDCGLAIADGGMLRDRDVIECERRRHDTNEYWDTMGVVKYRPGYDWYYMSYQDEPNVLLFKNYDSATDVPARNCLHTAFDMPQEDIPEDTPARESIEVRAFVFTFPEGQRRPSTVLQHPLAVQLEQSGLEAYIDQEHSITDRIRTDIDEGNEIKDAILVWRRQRIQRLERQCEALIAERHEQCISLQQAQTYSDHVQCELTIEKARNEALQRKVDELESKAQQQPSNLHRQIKQLSKELADSRLIEEKNSENISAKEGVGSEMERLQARLEQQERQIDFWKAEAMGAGNAAVSMCWQKSVDEAVKRERVKDAEALVSLTKEIEQL